MRMEAAIASGQRKRHCFQEVLTRCQPFEIKGILHSEMLFFNALVSDLKVDQIIESGRARGQSTEVIARFWAETDIEFDSIEFDESSPDTEVAQGRLRDLVGDKVRLHFGDAFHLAPALLKGERVAVLIDGPKGYGALNLAIKMLRYSNVVAVFLHDFHRDSGNHRKLVEKYCPSVLSTDAEEFVAAFRDIDNECWDEHQRCEDFRNWGPYRRGSRVMPSYGPTLVCMLNGFSEDELDAFSTAVKNAERRDVRPYAMRTVARFIPAVVKQSRVYRKLRGRI